MNLPEKTQLRVHAVLNGSRANGPGERAVLWFQGCKTACPGCFNPAARDLSGGQLFSVDQCLHELLKGPLPPQGITFSGGEPFLQKNELFCLLTALREVWEGSILIFSGIDFEILSKDAVCAACLSLSDALICGPYRKDLPPDYTRFCSSSNQRLMILSDRLCEKDFQDLPISEVLISPDGTILQSGLSSLLPMKEVI